MGFFSGGATGGGGGGVSGSGTTNKLPKWATSTSLTDSQLFDDGTSVAVGTTSPTSTFLFDVNTSAIVRNYFQVGTTVVNTSVHTGKIITDGIIESSIGVQLTAVNSGSLTKQGVFTGSNSVQMWAGATQIGTWGLNSNDGQNFLINTAFTPATTVGNTGTLNSLRVSANVRPALNTSNTTVQNQIVIDPSINQTNGTGTGSGTLRGIYYNPTFSGSGVNLSPHYAWENTKGDILFGNLSDATNLTTQVALLDETGKVIRQGSKTTFGLYQSGVSPVGININFATSTYIFGDDVISRSALKITTDNFIGRYGGFDQGIFLDFTNYAYKFGQIDNGTDVDVHHYVDGTSGSEIAYFQYDTNRIGYEFDFGASKTFKFGDFLGAFGNGSIQIDSSNETILIKGSQSSGSTTFEANSLIFTGSNLESSTSSGNSGQHLVITLNGTVYHIPLQDP